MAIFDHAHPKIIESNFSFPEFVTACKKSTYSICSFLRYSQFWSPVARLATSIFDHARENIFNCCLICMDLYQHAEISVNSKCSILKYSHQGTKSIFAEEIAD